MLVLDPLKRALVGEISSDNNQIPNTTTRISQDSRGVIQLPSGDEISSTTANIDHIKNRYGQQIYINTYPQYDPNVSYHGYDLSRDISEYQFGANNGHNQQNTTNRPVPAPRKTHSNYSSESELVKSKNGREQWSGRFDFFFSSLGYAVGFGAVWRFPYLCYRNGGGVFLIPYITLLFLLGIPLFYLEVNLGQFTSQGPVQCWRMAPIFKGLGISMSLMSFFLTVYYAMLLAYSILYLILSFRSKLEWTTCGSWASANCTDDFSTFVMRCNYENTYKDPNGRCYTWTDQGLTQIGWWDVQSRIQYRKPVLPTDDYFNNYILNKSPGMGFISTMEWPLVLCLLAAWVLVFICLCRGIKTSGKLRLYVVYFTAVFPYVILLILGIRGWTLPGMSRGIYFYMKPDLSRLADQRVWNDAANQIFFVLSVAYGGLITLSSYNKFTRSTLGNALVISITNVLTSIFAGFVIFAYLGYLSYMTGQEVQDVVSEGPGLAFIVYPYAVTTLPGAPFWSILFFFMLILLGLDSVFASVETIVVVITDQIHGLRRYNTLVILVVCIAMFALGLLLCTDAGIYWITFLDQFTGSYPAFVIGLLECICIAYIYGSNRFRADLIAMLGSKDYGVRLYRIFQICWLFITPMLIIALIIFTSINYPSLKLGRYNFPSWSYKLGWGLTGLILSGIVFYAIYAIIYLLLVKRNSWRALISPEQKWGPLLEQNRKKVSYYYGRQQGALVSLFDRLTKRTSSRDTLARSKSIDTSINEKEESISTTRPPSRIGSESAV
ncbi:unnamed protein product [Rotaria sordida]|uniref:Transporter n=1 Tax=Rotaria sordida TaxID=392033 RepID=A0A814KY87_9BILA|nr:unnamed protein product [Rotaria sordida]CAF1401163.1 unnamed protein product [Rotaria sordida]